MTSALIRHTQRRWCEDGVEREMATSPQAKGKPTAARGSKRPGRDTAQRPQRRYRPADSLITGIWPPEKFERISCWCFKPPSSWAFMTAASGSSYSSVARFKAKSPWFCSVTWDKVKVTRSCLTLWDSIDFSAHAILQARILEWVVFSFSRGYSQPRVRTQVSLIAGKFFTNWASWDRLLTLQRLHVLSCKKGYLKAKIVHVSVYMGAGSGGGAQSCLTLCDPMDYSPPGSSVHGDSPGKNTGLSCHASRDFSWPRDQTCTSCVSCIGSQILYHWEIPSKD